MSLFDSVAALPVRVEGYELERLEKAVSNGFHRVATVIRLRGCGEEGIGEDVTYAAHDQDLFLERCRGLDLGGDHTVDSFSARLAELPLFPEPPRSESSRDFRRWAFESAALDLALRQAGRSLASVLAREPRPVSFVVSLNLAGSIDMAPLRHLASLHPGMRFKLDPGPAWDDGFFAALRELGTVDVLDLKSFYRGTPVDQPFDAGLYRRVAAFPGVFIEDAVWNADTEQILGPHRERLTWDAPIHSVADIEGLPFPPRALNFKPSRFGGVRKLLDAYDYCAEREIGIYGGGQFELGPGRGHIQYLASLFHPEAPNDVSPVEYHDARPGSGAPASPLPPTPAATGFRWG